jgi:hypothetical protein
LLEVSGDEHWLHVANRYLSLLDRSAQSWTDLSTGKSAWGCAVLYRVTGEPGYRERALRALRALVALQAGDGGWLPCLDGDGGTSDAPTTNGYDVTVELAHWLALTGETVAQRDGIAWNPPARSGDEEPFDRWNRQAERIMLQLVRRASYRWQRTQRTVSSRLFGHE